MKRWFVFTVLFLFLLTIIGLGTSSAWIPKPVAQDPLPFMPGSQPGESGVASGPDRCDNCHGGYNAAVEPGGNWRGSMMAQAFRDPLFFATLAVALQDSIWALGNPNAGDICIRCHSPSGWLEGRSDPTNATTLTGVDFDGVQCDYCHRSMDMLAVNDQLTASNGSPDVPAENANTVGWTMAAQTKAADLAYLRTLTLFDLTPFLDPADNWPWYIGPFPAYQEAGAGQHFNDSANIMRGPFTDAVARHQMYYSRWHKSKEFCHDCHDVSNPLLANFTATMKDSLGNGNASSRFAAASYFHVERTFSEFLTGKYGKAATPIATTIPTKTWDGLDTVIMANKCQDCHMRDVYGQGCNKADAPMRKDLPLHDMTGGNSWLSGILASADPNNAALYDPYNYNILAGVKYPGAKVDMSGLIGWGTKLQAGRERAIQQIQYGSTLEDLSPGVLAKPEVIRIKNNSAHKLISGYPEGRRLFLNVKWYDSAGNLIPGTEINPYLPLQTGKDGTGNDTYLGGGDLDHAAAGYRDDLVFEAKMQSDLTGEYPTLHFALGTGRYKDNRIPPAGFAVIPNTNPPVIDNTAMTERQIEPVWPDPTTKKGVSRPDLFTAAEYAGGYKDVSLTPPINAAKYVATLYYQTTSKEYVTFLRDELAGVNPTLSSPTFFGEPTAYLAQTDPFFANLKDWGKALWDLWLHNGGSAPVMMTQLSSSTTPPQPAVTITAPTNLAATAGKGSVALKWTASTVTPVGTPLTYKIYTLSAGKYTYVGTSTTTSWTHSKLRAGQTFTYVVTGTATVSGVTYESAYSTQATATVR